MSLSRPPSASSTPRPGTPAYLAQHDAWLAETGLAPQSEAQRCEATMAAIFAAWQAAEARQQAPHVLDRFAHQYWDALQAYAAAMARPSTAGAEVVAE